MNMFCPVCKKALVVWKKLRMESVVDHVGDPNGVPPLMEAYRCPDPLCITRKNFIFWNYEGELFSDKYISSEDMRSIKFIAGNDAPFGTFQRKMNVEIYKKNENKLLVKLPSWFPSVWSGMKIYSDWRYTSNENGDILKRRLKIRCVKKDGVIYMGFRMLKHVLRENFKAFFETMKSDDKWFKKLLLENAKKEPIKDEWWRRCGKSHAKFLVWVLKVFRRI